MDKKELQEKLSVILKNLDIKDVKELDKASKAIDRLTRAFLRINKD